MGDIRLAKITAWHSLAFSPALRSVCQVEKKFTSKSNQSDKLSKDVTTRWPSTPVAANWSGGRWRADSFLHQGADFEPPSSERSFTSPVVTMLSLTSPPSCPGIQWLSLGNQLENLLWPDTSMQLLLFQSQLLLCFVKIKLR